MESEEEEKAPTGWRMKKKEKQLRDGERKRRKSCLRIESEEE